ncbi:MAG: restriction endonuclease subunit S [Acidihalobacter sp.]|uniref:restriction endonuclease subunit S n=1 Tax=Acidihalobacter sp. TaxID=1872108 RepID=UPI00307DF593
MKNAAVEIVPTALQDVLPCGWTLSTIQDLVGASGVFVDGDWVESKDQDPDGDVRLIQLADIGDGEYRNKSARFLTHEKALELGCTFLEKGDVLVARMPDPLGRACIFPGDSKKAVTVVDVAIVRSSGGEFNHLWLMYFINSPAFRSAVASLQGGSTRKRISRKNLSKIALPVPPFDQQKRIVAEIEKQFSRLDEAVANLKRVRANLKRYKAAVLKAAVEGRLVETEAELARRAAQGSANVAGGRMPGATEGRSYENGEQLLQRILETRRSQWQGKRKYKEPAAPDTTDLPELPEGWVWATVEQLTWLVTSGSRGWGDYYSDEGVLFIRAQDIKTDRLSVRGVARVEIPRGAEGTRSGVSFRDILITITGANVTKSALVPELGESAFVSQHVALLKLNFSEMAPFVFDWIISPSNGRKLLESWAYGAGKPGLSLEQVRSLPVAIPPLDEQHRIVAEVDRRLSLLRETEAQVDANLQRAERLRQSILSRAFSGGLVSTDEECAA